MGKILILYHSDSGNTKKMADLVAAGAQTIPDMEVRLKSVDEADKGDVTWCDGIAVGSPTNMRLVSHRMKEFWDVEMQESWGKLDGKIGCAFSSSGGWGGGAEITCQSILTILLNFGILVFGAPDYVAHQFTLHYGAVVAGEPCQNREIEACKRLGERLAQWVACLIDKHLRQHPAFQSNRFNYD